MEITSTTRALVTGANGGLGQEIARALSRRGARLLLSGRRADALEVLREELSAEVVVADLAERGDVDRLAEAALDCDVLVLNAALPASGLLDDFEPHHIDARCWFLIATRHRDRNNSGRTSGGRARVLPAWIHKKRCLRALSGSFGLVAS
jgi:NADP-dependent 3-hydroxy acid dehydrogenase YdfG